MDNGEITDFANVTYVINIISKMYVTFEMKLKDNVKQRYVIQFDKIVVVDDLTIDLYLDFYFINSPFKHLFSLNFQAFRSDNGAFGKINDPYCPNIHVSDVCSKTKPSYIMSNKKRN